ncbi:MAG: TRAP transporter permease [Hyphomicrobiales bacterium]|nr:TRAP transporter permease [Hyphomicrobiales bacterium]MCP5370979.1 TRAP transporter permease [Hyphomicrobiales bacterium]
MTPTLDRVVQWTVATLVIVGAAFAIYTGATGPFEAPVQRGFFVLAFLPLVFLLTPSRLPIGKTADTLLSMLLAATVVVIMVWDLVNFERLYSDPFLETPDIVLGAIGLVLVLEAVRRTVGMSIMIILVLFLLYAFFGKSVPIAQLRHGGLDTETIVSIIFYGTDGVFGTPIAVCSTFIVIIIMLGAFLTSCGGADFFMNISKIIAGRLMGGPAKIAVIGSALMGMVTGATVANVATTGSVTIPMMKRTGYDPRFAGAVEALASSGGQLMPPIMGAAAFVMIDYLNISYAELVIHAIVPALLYFFSVLLIVHVRSVKRGFKAIPKSEIPNPWHELKARGHMMLPIIVLVAMLSQRYGIMYVAFFSTLTAMIVCQFRKETRLDLKGYYETFYNAATGMVSLVAICAGAGILIGTLTATGLNLKITYLIEFVAQGSLFLTLVMTMIACIILGMGLPTVAAYVVLATLVPSSMIKLGVEPIAAHLFIFYFAILSAITPPVCTGAYVAAGIAKADPVQTGFVAMRLGLIVFLLPFAFTYDPSLLLVGSNLGETVLHVGTCALGICFWAYGLEGYFRRKIYGVARVLLMVSGAMLVWPDLWVSMAGFVVGALGMIPAVQGFALKRDRRMEVDG